MENHLSQTDVRYRIEWYPNTEHGFVFPDRGAKYHQNASERHWHRILSLFERNLKKK
ncbi:MAG: dienelactone hydrolase family protein [SAR324 cluster bacterium]|nr:dienelactone hydrolase family protein [SAR324 cluster bacterium]MDP7501610.1 dienelactone hydrolase family protein [SAR324 cluster bacterium]